MESLSNKTIKIFVAISVQICLAYVEVLCFAYVDGYVAHFIHFFVLYFVLAYAHVASEIQALDALSTLYTAFYAFIL